jgi:hypothetical protein
MSDNDIDKLVEYIAVEDEKQQPMMIDDDTIYDLDNATPIDYDDSIYTFKSSVHSLTNESNTQLLELPIPLVKPYSRSKRFRYMNENIPLKYEPTQIIQSIELKRLLNHLTPIGDRPWYLSMGGTDRRTVNTLLLHCPHCTSLRDRVIAIDFEAKNKPLFSFDLEFCKICRRFNDQKHKKGDHIDHSKIYYQPTINNNISILLMLLIGS